MDIQAKVCALFADFSRLPSEKALPYIAWLDLAESRLTPGALQRQKFVYHIAPVDRRETLDSARFALRLCRQISFARARMAGICHRTQSIRWRRAALWWIGR